MSSKRVYLDYNATTPLTKPCKDSMTDAMSIVGNASSVHYEGRRVRSLIEDAREKISSVLGADPENLFFTSGATESASLLLKEQNCVCAEVEHPCVGSWCEKSLQVSKSGIIKIDDLKWNTVQLANSETGILQPSVRGLYMSDLVQAVGKINFCFKTSGIRSGIISAHKFGGPQGIGAVVTEANFNFKPQVVGGGQEKGRRSGTENLIAIVGFGAAIEFAKTQLDDGIWEKIEELRNLFEEELANRSPSTIFVGKGGARLPNTSCFITPGWTGQMQVMQMDLAGFSISAGSACSSGKIRRNDTLVAMGFHPELAECSVRISLGTKTTKSDIHSFIKAWAQAQDDRNKRVA
ncbi:MAG: cysteine desulfurase family protein [Paracoccaceae bacterium]|nr:cysteine desulfurase family protein [Paracoccaceae bacterium]